MRTDRPAEKPIALLQSYCDEFEAYGYRRVGAELRHRGMVVNSKKNSSMSRRIIGYAISRSIDARVAVAALKAAIRVRQTAERSRVTLILI